MKQMKERWDEKYPGLPVIAQCLRDNAARISKDKVLLNLLEVQDQSETVKMQMLRQLYQDMKTKVRQ